MTDKRSSVSPGAGQANLIAPAYLWIAGLKGWRALAFCAALGAFANLAFPPVHFWPAFAVALTGLVWCLDGAALAPRPGRAAFWRVAAFGFAYYLVGMHWIAWAFLVNPGSHLIFIWMPLIALPSILTFVLSACVYLGFRFWQPGPARLIIFAVSFMFGEWVRGALFGIGGLPWNLPGMIWSAGRGDFAVGLDLGNLWSFGADRHRDGVACNAGGPAGAGQHGVAGGARHRGRDRVRRHLGLGRAQARRCAGR
jgi:apolipoprotein N-acyltransferase